MITKAQIVLCYPFKNRAAYDYHVQAEGEKAPTHYHTY